MLGPGTLADSDRVTASLDEHAAVLAALQARDGVAAEAAMRAHVEAALSMRLRALRGREIPLHDQA